MKKIANEPNLLRKWLLEKAENESNPTLIEEFEELAHFINADTAMNQEAVESRARRKAYNVGLVASKGTRPYLKHNIGLFQLTNERTNKTVGGIHFQMTANEVIDYCKALNYSIYQHTNIPRELYQQDADLYWKTKETIVDELYKKGLFPKYEEWIASTDNEEDEYFSLEEVTNPQCLPELKHRWDWRQGVQEVADALSLSYEFMVILLYKDGYMDNMGQLTRAGSDSGYFDKNFDWKDIDKLEALIHHNKIMKATAAQGVLH